MGVLQAVAVIPGLSRSGATISGGLMRGVSREEAADFSFLMSIPVILGSCVLQGRKVIRQGLSNIGASVGGLPALVGVIVAAVSGYFAIHFFLSIVRKQKMSGFAVYTLILGTLVLLDHFALHLYF